MDSYLTLGKIRNIHFVGIGGIGMSGIAELLLNLGFAVSGSDLKETAVIQRLRELGAAIALEHSAANVQGAQVVVYSSAVSPGNPEVLEARRLHIPVIPRAEMLAELMRLKFSIAVAGAHGKTTVTSMIAVMLTHAGLDPTAVIGGRLDVFGSSARLGKGQLMVVEADESDRSFLYLLPSIAVVTNIDREHLDHYKDIDEIRSAFLSFMNKTPFYGAVIACWDHPWKEAFAPLLPKVRRRLITYGNDPGSHLTSGAIRANHAGSSFEVLEGGRELGRFTLAVPGLHNVQNALAAVAVGLELGLDVDSIRDGLKRFRGADRRFQIKAEQDGITVVDDYGHHPTEIRATLEAARAHGAERIWAVFQPHRYTRTQFLLDDFAPSFEGVERVYVMDIYAASEHPIPGVTSQALVQRMREQGCLGARYAPREEEMVREILAEAHPPLMVMTIGAGNVWRVGDDLAESLRRSRRATADPR
ncbi:MAG TPA: UDP-N-acetylmuramate--L-alanine ligase [Terriglobia bacterium]|nr:UDP-N-acetylmuramate--L-alanine ligase [Terriglobia bacterium]